MRKNKYSQPLVYAIRSLDKFELNRSQSGAAFFEFAKTFYNQEVLYMEPDWSQIFCQTSACGYN